MAYRDNVSAVAAKLGISNDSGLREEDLDIAELRFTDGQGNVLTTIEATPMNKGGRLFFQDAGTHTDRLEDAISFIEDIYYKPSLHVDDALRQKASQYFAELWEPNPEPGKRTLLDAIRDPKHTEVEIGWK